ncbi:hypothetical protein BACCAP_00551 [Pseudoflavonifractor capillosus ATCC 29799]|uniref:Uncharacterized protein n=1 Tax=Pseudoflavonifractor capillosus ATCC 29799 TaxID=411467 RepID=A6NQT0_9FIRM|nr:hypothetical protein BACCAP_00551 [Pseudoflavonifractor capillosus ATCC 29799]
MSELFLSALDFQPNSVENPAFFYLHILRSKAIIISALALR